MQSRKLVASPLGKDLHAAVVIVAHPPGNAEDVRLALDEPAEADALHASAHQETAGFDGLFSEQSHFRKIAILSGESVREREADSWSKDSYSLKIPQALRGISIDSLEEFLAVPP
jgi:hypothetical protein